jgi:hypothetical protein
MSKSVMELWRDGQALRFVPKARREEVRRAVFPGYRFIR